ncbi:hypothetical protein FQN57_001738 [Myotisia sp. PD_48]|nr:hypothetical protein FQN57_001738 [Myotisia sp. PD_48]
MAQDKPVAASNIPRHTLSITIWVFFGLVTVLLICRLGIRGWFHRRLFWDDIFAIIAFFLLLVENILITVAKRPVYMLLDVYQGMPQPPDFHDQVTDMIKLMFSHNFIFITCIYAVKASLLALLWRLIEGLPHFRKGWWGITILSSVCYLITIIFAPITCSTLKSMACISPRHIMLDNVSLRFGTGADVATDILIMCLPIALVMKSHLPAAQKIALVGLFLLGLTVISVAIVRIVATDAITKHPPSSWLLFWSAIESSVAVMISCFAAFKSLFNLERRPSEYQHSSGYIQSDTYLHSSGNNKAGKKVRRSDIPLSPRVRLKKEHARLGTAVVSTEPQVRKWKQNGSQEEILQEIEFGVSYERNKQSA